MPPFFNGKLFLSLMIGNDLYNISTLSAMLVDSSDHLDIEEKQELP
jgi:hypothetical protein